MRTHTGPERTLLAGDFNTHVKVEVANSAGTWIDLSAYFVEARWTRSIDTPIVSGTITLLRDLDGTVSIAPTMAASPMNQVALTFSPLVDGGRAVRLSTAQSTVGGAAGAYREMFIGRIDNPEWGGDENTMTIAISDIGAWLMSTHIQVLRTYGDTAGVPVQTVMQQILTDNPNAILGAVTLYTPIDPGWDIRAYEQSKVPVLEALRALAQQIGWDVRYQYDAADAYVLTFYQPDRAKTVTDDTFGPSEYYAIPSLTKNTDDVRTLGKVRFLDHATNAVLEATASAGPVAIAQYGERYIEISEDASSNIDSITEAQEMIDAIISDLDDAFATQELETSYMPLTELGDLYEFAANAVHYDLTQNLAVAAFTHVLTLKGDSTVMTCRGKVAGAYKTWLLTHGTALPVQGAQPDDVYLTNFRIIARDDTSVTYGWDDSPGAAEIWEYDKTVTVPFSVEPWPDPLVPADPDTRFTAGAGTLKLDFPTEEHARFVQLDLRTAAGESGHQYRIILYPTGLQPSFGKITQAIGASGLYAAIRIDIIDPQNLGGVLEAWVNHDDWANADPTLPVDGTLSIGATPYTASAADSFDTGLGPVSLLSNIRVHPGRGKLVYFRFTNSRGTPSEIASFQILSEGGIIDENGDLVPGAIRDALEFSSGVQPVQVFASTLPATAPDGTFAYLISTGKIYKRISGAWDSSVAGADIVTGSITVGKLAAGSVTATAMTASAASFVFATVSVLSAINPDLGIIVAGQLNSVSGGVIINLNATGSSAIITGASGSFRLNADGSAYFALDISAATGTFSGTVAAANFTSPTARFNQSVALGGGIFPPNFPTSIAFHDTSAFVTVGIVSTLSSVPYTGSAGKGLSISNALYLSTLVLGGSTVQIGPAGSGPGGSGQALYI